MNVKAWIPLVAAVGLGLVAAMLVRDAMRRGAAKREGAEGNQAAVVVAARDLEVGRKIEAGDLATSKMSPDSLPAGSFNDPARLLERVVTVPLVKNQPVLENALAAPGTGAGVQALLKDGQRAITLEVNEFSGVGGMIEPGSRVDVISIVRDDASAQSLARTVVQNLRVLAVGKSLSAPRPDAPPAPFNNVTLLVTPEQAQAVQLASSTGRPWLVLRNTHDEEEVDAQGTSLADLRGDERNAPPLPPVAPVAAEAAPAPKPRPRPAVQVRVVKVIRGGTQTEVSFPVPVPQDAEGSGAEGGQAPGDWDEVPEPLLTGNDEGPAVK